MSEAIKYWETEEFQEKARKYGAFRWDKKKIRRIIEDKKSLSYVKLGKKWNRSATAMRKLMLRHGNSGL